ncbi:MAG: hypothetical protein QF464_02525, partial [Myxococcota bacterium]|nr:hypothetical protein [Myxococcota bacterium]
MANRCCSPYLGVGNDPSSEVIFASSPFMKTRFLPLLLACLWLLPACGGSEATGEDVGITADTSNPPIDTGGVTPPDT